ncbi:MAG TPA: polyprenyl diphosphate synthase [Gammaproteobacteria bacterium]|nr:polyprenyl diphosphate synthase [Gammaproteobacteria bacterium]
MKKSYAHYRGEKASQNRLPQHVAIIMDGNGRWAKQRFLPRTAGHRQGVETVRQMVKASINHGIRVLSLFAFGKENWKRPVKEVRTLFRLLFLTLKKEINDLHKQGVRLQIIGDKKALAPMILDAIQTAELQTHQNQTLLLNIFVNYSGRWDIQQALKKTMGNPQVNEANCEYLFEKSLCLSDVPEPDLFIRTAGVQRLSNFMLWDLAYTELYFTQTLWPAFSLQDFEEALNFYTNQERRFGLISEQVENTHA